MRQYEQNGISYTHFDTFTECIDYCNSSSTKELARRNREKYHDYYSPGYHYFENFATAVKHANSGWKEGYSKVKAILDRCDFASKVFKPEIKYDVIGDSGIDIGRYVTGEPECMMDWIDTEVMKDGNPIVKIVVNIFVSAAVQKEVIIAKGAAICALVDTLETSGKRVDLTAVLATSAHDNNPTSQVYIPIKHADESLQIDQLAFILANPDMFRRFGLLLIATNGINGKAQASFGGYPADIKPTDDTSIYIGCSSSLDANFQTVEATKNWIVSSLRSLGLTIEQN